MAIQASPSGSAALIAAHPGHETLLHHWVERARPTVFLLTDGSGGAAGSRLEHSRRLIENAGARCGTVFGEAADRLWYRDLLQANATRFHAVLRRLETECLMRGVTTIVSDPVELFNPIHDLANALARALGRRLTSHHGREVELLTYPIEQPEAFAVEQRRPLALNRAAAKRKGAAILAYSPLAEEYPHYRELATADHEIIAADPGFAWPEHTPEPFYERFGKQRLHERRYETLITYAKHVRPMALKILEDA